MLMLTAGSAQNSGLMMVIYIVVFGAMMYFMIYRPNQKEKKRTAELMASMAVVDSVLTNAGFYGTLIDITEDTVIVEFGNNKNCRIPMKKTAIIEIEKPEL